MLVVENIPSITRSTQVWLTWKKRIDSGALETLTVESAVLTPVAVGYLLWLQATGALVFGHHGGGQSLLLASSGLVTLIPLLLFAAAATRLPLSTVGLLQYLTPMAQFLLGVLWFHEAMPPYRWIGFTLVWAALAVLSFDALRGARKSSTARAAETVSPPSAARGT